MSDFKDFDKIEQEYEKNKPLIKKYDIDKYYTSRYKLYIKAIIAACMIAGVTYIIFILNKNEKFVRTNNLTNGIY
jgi:hypothetical protein